MQTDGNRQSISWNCCAIRQTSTYIELFIVIKRCAALYELSCFEILQIDYVVQLALSQKFNI